MGEKARPRCRGKRRGKIREKGAQTVMATGSGVVEEKEEGRGRG